MRNWNVTSKYHGKTCVRKFMILAMVLILMSLILIACSSNNNQKITPKETPIKKTQVQSLVTPLATQLISTARNSSLNTWDNSQADSDKTIITDIANWNHPVKSYMEQNSITIKKVELKDNKTYPIFYVTMKPESYNKELLDKIIKSISRENGFWDYSLVDESNNTRIEVYNDKKNLAVKSFILNGTKTQIPDDNIKPEYRKYVHFLKKEDEVNDFIREDIDLDGNKEIVISFGAEGSQLEVYVLREKGGIIKNLGEFDGGGYGVYGVNLVNMKGVKHRYINAFISNGGGLAGFDLYEVAKDGIKHIAGSASATGSGNDGLTSSTGNSIHDGFVQRRHSYDVMYFGVERYYIWNGKSFDYVYTNVDTGEYPTDVEGVVEQFLRLHLLFGDDRKSKDVAERLSEINLSGKSLDNYKIDEIFENNRDLEMDLLSGSLKFDTRVNGDLTTITVPIGDRRIIFSLSRNGGKFQITDMEGDINWVQGE